MATIATGGAPPFNPAAIEARDALHAVNPVRFCVDRLGFTPDPWQQRVLEGTGDTILNCSRQSGKSYTVAALATHKAVYTPGSLVLLIAPSQRQSGLLFRHLSKFVERLGPEGELLTDNKLSCRFPNGSEVVSLPGEPDNIRGYSAPQLVVLDEAAFLSDQDAMIDAVAPMLAISRGRLILMSTPAGQSGFFYETWMSGDPDWLRIMATADDCPRIDRAWLAKQQRRLAHYKFRQEFYGEFMQGKHQVIASEYIDAAITPDLSPLFTADQLSIMQGF